MKGKTLCWLRIQYLLSWLFLTNAFIFPLQKPKAVTRHGWIPLSVLASLHYRPSYGILVETFNLIHH
jgi:hypothetical protein